MRKIIVILAMMIATALVLSSGKPLDRRRQLTRQVRLFQEENNDLKKSYEKYLNFADTRPQSLIEGYNHLFNDTRVIASFYDVKSSVFVENIKDKQDIQAKFQESRFKGVYVLDTNIIFKEIEDDETYVKILELLFDLERQRPIEIVRVSRSAKSLSLNIKIYGIYTGS